MKTSDFYYDLPEELIAQHPIENRSNSRLMVLDKENGKIEHKCFKDIINYLNKGDCIVLNDTKVIPARLFGHREGKEGTDAMYRIPKLKAGLGEAMGVVFEAAGHETVYVAGDTIWRSEVDQAIQTFKPDVIVLNTGNALVDGFKESIIMGKEDTYHATQKAPNAKVVAVHMDAINHMSVTRAELADYVKDKGIQDKVLIPIDGETLSF